MLIAVGSKASLKNEAIKFYQALIMSRAQRPNTLANCPLLELDNVCDVMVEAPERLAISLKFFLHGLGLVPQLPMELATAAPPAWINIRPRALSLDETNPKFKFNSRRSFKKL